MHEVAMGYRLILTLPEYGQSVLHRTGAEPVYPQARLDRLRVGERRVVFTTGIDHIADHAAVADIQAALLYEVAVGGGVEVGVVGHVVHMTVDVVIRPAGGDRVENPVIRPRRHPVLTHAAAPYAAR